MEEPKDFGLLADEDEINSFVKVNTKTPIKQASKFHISPNRPNSSAKLELKSIERPRSHSPMKMSGIEEYVQLYSKNPLTTCDTQNKITMNLKMDDLLANKNESSSYQMLSDFSVLTGDSDNFEFKSKTRKKSLDVLNITEVTNELEDEDDDADEEDEDKEKRNLNYKYTAVYKIDESTGAFQEKSKIVFEAKKQPPPPPPPQPVVSSLAKSQLEIALEALKNNSKNLDAKLEKLDDITASSNSYFDSNVSDLTPSPTNEPLAVTNQIKKKNESFFNDILSKSDDLITQTQNKLEKLSKLETVNKPLTALTQSTPPPPKPKPTASIIVNNPPNMLGSPSNTSINSSKSLIDLKSNEPIDQPAKTPDPIANTQVDLLFDLDQSFIIASEPIKQGESYFDLLGLSNPVIEDQTNVAKTISINSDLLNLGDICLSEVKPEVVAKQMQMAPMNIDILITEPTNERDDNNVVPDGFFNLKHEIPYDQSRPHSPINQTPQQTQQQEQFSLELDFSKISTVSNSSPTTPTSISRSRPVSPTANRPSRPPSPTALIKSRPTSPKPITPTQPIPEMEIIEKMSKSSEFEMEKPESEKKVLNYGAKKEKVKKKIWTQADSQGESSSSSSDDDEQQKFQIRIRPKAVKSLNPDSNTDDATTKSAFIPLLPKPPKSAEEIEEFRQRRRSSDAGSITRSIKEDTSDEEQAISTVQSEAPTKATTSSERKESVKSEFNLELPDEDDSLPLNDFNEKYELSQYTDGTYGCMVLVRQPFRNPNVMYKNAIQKMTEVRTWTECLVKLVDSNTSGKKLVFYNAHELITLAAEQDTKVEKIIETCLVHEPPEATISNSNEETSRKIHPFHEIELKTSYKFTDMCLQQFDNYSKIHTFKIQDIVFKETIQMRPDRLMALPERFLKRFTKPKVTSLLDHTPLPFEICKFGHLSYSYLRSFLMLLQDTYWSLPTITRKKQREEQLQQIQQAPATTAMSITAAAASLFSLGSNKQIQTPTLTSVTATHTREEITVKVIDEYRCKLDKDCRIKEHKSRTRVYLIAFLNSPEPLIEIGLNDVLRHGKEIVGRYDIIPIKTEQWISPEAFELNEKIVDKEEFEKTHCLRCVQMPDNLLVEIMRFRTRPRRNYELPLQVRCFMSVVGRLVEIRIECTVAGGYYTNVSDVFCEDIQIRFPLPDVWVYLFRVEKMFRYGAVHSTKHKLGKIKGLDRLLVHKTTHQGAVMEASCGMAKYEQAFKSLVWRIDQLPAKNKDIYKTQLFICKLNLQEYDNLPEKYEEIAQVQYSLPICASSKCQVRSVSVNTSEEPPEKWAKLKSKFEYDLEINYILDQKELPTVDQEKCAELQHLTQTESENDNENNDDDD